MSGRLVALALLTVVTPASAQHAFAAIEDGGARVVKEMRGNRAFVHVDGQPRASTATRFALFKATVYRPGLVTLSHLRVGTWHLEHATGGSSSYRLQIRGQAESDTSFTRCFLVLELDWWKESGWIFVELPDLPANRSVPLDFVFPLQVPLEEGRYRLHLFSDGVELLHTRMPEDYRAKQRAKTEGLLAGKKDFPAIAERIVKPEYPAALKSRKIGGSARIRCQVEATGVVSAPELLHASEPEFGSAALAAIGRWRFDPALRNRRLVPSTVEVPFTFDPSQEPNAR